MLGVTRTSSWSSRVPKHLDISEPTNCASTSSLLQSLPPPPSPHPWNHSIHWSIKCISLLRRSSSSSASYIYLPPSVLFFFPPSDYTYSSISAWLQNPPTSCRRVYRPDIYSIVKVESIQSCDCWLKGFLTFVDFHCCTEGRILSFQNFSIGRTISVSSMGGKIKLLSKKNHETNRLSFSLPVD